MEASEAHYCREALVKKEDNALGKVRHSVCLGVPRAHYTPLQRYMFFEKFRGPWWFFVLVVQSLTHNNPGYLLIHYSKVEVIYMDEPCNAC